MGKSEATALVGIDHPMVREAIRNALANGIRVATFISAIRDAHASVLRWARQPRGSATGRAVDGSARRRIDAADEC